MYCLVAVHWQELDKCTLVAFNCLLRTGELLQLRIADTMMNNLLTFANVDLPDSIGIMEPVSKQQLSFVSLHALYRHSQAIRVPQAFCRCLIDKFSRNNLVLKPYRYETKRCRAFSGHKFIGCRCPQRPGQTNVSTYLHEPSLQAPASLQEAKAK